MANLFQKSVEKKYLNEISKDLLKEKFAKFQNHFAKPDIQQNIRGLKEEEYQEGFVRDLFVEILGYTLKPQPSYNIELEKKNVNDSKKADGAILYDEKIIAVIELKGTDTTDLKSVEVQAFGYKNNQPDCKYIITSNFEKLRFYINNAVDHEEFNLFNLTEERFGLLWLCLAKENVLTDLPLKIKNASVLKEENVTKELYKDYSSFKHDLFRNIVELNPGFDKLLLFKKSQKLLDRFLFIFFAEDKSLLPPNSISEIAKQWEELKDLDEYTPLYNRFKKYFGYLNTGHKGKKHNIFAYNGGLFTPDEILDSILIDDELLKKHVLQFSNYDFESEVDVNILGHIFEHSLNELDLIQSELDGKTIEKNKTKRKKDGVFYTPKYITKYIVENTVGKLCEEKKIELDISDAVYENAKKRSRKRIENIDKYRKWLLSLTICDPACGSGAFLNMALDFLITEHRYLDELTASYHNVPIVFTDVENHILEKNLFGVDINEESVEIARLSLWLRTAQPGRKLTTLSNNIKCGNSLIDDSAVAGEKAFNWKNEFPAVFANGGFNVVIGNPPYGAKFTEQEKEFCKTNYPNSTEGKIDSYRIFIEKCFSIGKPSALISLITPNTFLYNLQSFSLRKLIFSNVNIYDAVELRKNIFEDAPDVVTVIISFENKIKDSYSFRARVAYHNVLYYDIKSSNWEIDQNIQIENLKKEKDLKINLRSNFNFSSIKNKIEKFNILELNFNLKQGTKPYGKKDEKECELISKRKIDENWEKAINGRNISRYYLEFEKDYVKRTEDLHSVLPLEIIENEKIYFQRMRKISLFPRIIACYDNDKYHGLYTCSVITKKKESKIELKYLLCILNSRLINIWYKYFDTDIEIKLASVKQIPIPEISLEKQNKFIVKANLILSLKVEFKKNINQFTDLFQSKFDFEKINSKLQKWYELEFKEFLSELKSIKIKLSLSEEADWMQYFNKQKQKAQELKSEIDKIDKEIDKMVYELYGLTEEDIRVVEKMNNN